MGNQAGKFISHLVEKDKTLRDLLSKRNCWSWSSDQDKAFKTLKEALTSPPVLAMYDLNRGLGGVLLQMWEEAWRPVACALRSLSPVENGSMHRWEKRLEP